MYPGSCPRQSPLESADSLGVAIPPELTDLLAAETPAGPAPMATPQPMQPLQTAGSILPSFSITGAPSSRLASVPSHFRHALHTGHGESQWFLAWALVQVGENELTGCACGVGWDRVDAGAFSAVREQNRPPGFGATPLAQRRSLGGSELTAADCLTVLSPLGCLDDSPPSPIGSR
jgi:hypothetical protein